MNYYEHHIGDYAEATAHLSFVEDAAYSRMIRKYYALEGPLPADLRAVQRLICARSEEERDAVQIVLGEFFTLEADGYHNARCDEEISRFREKQEKARNSANARWKKGKPQSEGNAGDNDAALPPQSEGNATASESHNERNANASNEACERIETGCEGNALQSPVTNTLPNGNYERESTRTHAPSTLTSCPADFTPTVAHRGLAMNLNLDLQNELGMFLANARSKGRMSADWNAEFEMWLRRSRNFGNGKDQQPGTSTQSAAQSRDDARRAASNTLGVGSQYLTGGMDHAQIRD